MTACHPLSPSFAAAPADIRLSEEQRVLLEQVQASRTAFASARKRAELLLLIHRGLPLRDIQAKTHTGLRTLRSLIERHRTGGLRMALLGRRPSIARCRWLALSPMR